MNKEIAEQIVWAILSNIVSRRGWRQEWDEFDEDTKQEIISDWIKIVINDGVKS